MSKAFLPALCLAMLTCIQGGLYGADWFVDPNLSNANRSDHATTFSNLQDARDAVRLARQTRDTAEPDTIYLQPGLFQLTETFELNHEDTGSSDAPITWKAVQPHQSILTGPSLSALIAVYDLEELRLEGLRLIGAADQAIEVAHCHRVTIANCQIASIGHTGLHLFGGRECEVRDCSVIDCGSIGIRIEAGDHDNDQAANHVVANCKVSRCGGDGSSFASAFFVAGLGHTIAGNHISDCEGPGVRLLGDAHLVTENHLDRTCLDSVDTAAILYSQSMGNRGSRIERNVVQQVATTPRLDAIAIYLSSQVSNTVVNRNVIVSAGRGIAIAGGSQNQVSENLLQDCQIAIQVDGMQKESAEVGQTKQSNQIEHNLLQRSGRVAVDTSDTFHANRFAKNIVGDRLFVLATERSATSLSLTALAAIDHPHVQPGEPLLPAVSFE